MQDKKTTLSTRTWLAETDPTQVSAKPEMSGIGRIIDGQFVLKRRLGQGGFGVAWLADQLRAGSSQAFREVVIKLAHFKGNERGQARRFVREADVLAKLKNDHLVTVYRCGELADGQLFIAMEYGGEETLSELLKREGRLPWRRVLQIGTQICEALEEAARWNVVHRDLKPANILMSRRGKQDWAKVVDFGIARITEPDVPPGTANAAPTETGDFIGTPSYASPEQAQGGVVDGRSDIYSLGVVLYELLTGSRPFQKKDPSAALLAHVSEQPPPLSKHAVEVPPLTEALLWKALAKSPMDRFQTAAELREAMERALDPVAEPAAEVQRGSVFRIVIAGAVGVVVLAVAGLGVWRKPAATTASASAGPIAPSLPRASLLLRATNGRLQLKGTRELQSEVAAIVLNERGRFEVESEGLGVVALAYQRENGVVHLSQETPSGVTLYVDGVVLQPESRLDVTGEPRKVLFKKDSGVESVVLVRLQQDS